MRVARHGSPRIIKLKQGVMKHCVFCAALCAKNKSAIDRAKRAVDAISTSWMLEEDCVMCSYHSEFSVVEKNGNIGIYLENSDPTQLINDCMEYARTIGRNE